MCTVWAEAQTLSTEEFVYSEFKSNEYASVQWQLWKKTHSPNTERQIPECHHSWNEYKMSKLSLEKGLDLAFAGSRSPTWKRMSRSREIVGRSRLGLKNKRLGLAPQGVVYITGEPSNTFGYLLTCLPPGWSFKGWWRHGWTTWTIGCMEHPLETSIVCRSLEYIGSNHVLLPGH